MADHVFLPRTPVSDAAPAVQDQAVISDSEPSVNPPPAPALERETAPAVRAADEVIFLADCYSLQREGSFSFCIPRLPASFLLSSAVLELSFG